MVNDNKAKVVAQYALMFALIMVAMSIDKLISVFSLSMAIFVLLVTNSLAMLDNRWISAILAGTFFGLASLFKELVFPSGFYQYIINPLVSVLPRVIMGITLFGTYRLMLLATKKMRSSYGRQTLCMTIAVLIGLITNTMLFLSALYIHQVVSGDNTTILAVLKIVSIVNILPEYLVSLILVPHLVLGVRRGLKLGIDGNLWKSDNILPDTDNGGNNAQ